MNRGAVDIIRAFAYNGSITVESLLLKNIKTYEIFKSDIERLDNAIKDLGETGWWNEEEVAGTGVKRVDYLQDLRDELVSLIKEQELQAGLKGVQG